MPSNRSIDGGEGSFVFALILCYLLIKQLSYYNWENVCSAQKAVDQVLEVENIFVLKFYADGNWTIVYRKYLHGLMRTNRFNILIGFVTFRSVPFRSVRCLFNGHSLPNVDHVYLFCKHAKYTHNIPLIRIFVGHVLISINDAFNISPKSIECNTSVQPE